MYEILTQNHLIFLVYNLGRISRDISSNRIWMNVYMNAFQFNPRVSDKLTYGPTGYGRSVWTDMSFDMICK